MIVSRIWRGGLEVWHFQRTSAAVSVRRACGHVDHTRLARKRLAMRVSAYEATPCAECLFYAVLAESRGATDSNRRSEGK
jgi:hypothetical protein